MKGNAIARIVLFSIAILVLGGILIGGMLLYTFAVNTDWNEVFDFAGGFFASSDGTVASRGEVDPSQIKNIEIDWTSGSVTVQKGNVDTITFAETPGLDENQKMQWRVKGDTLEIDCSKYKVIIGITKSKDLVVTVPTDWDCRDLEISTVDADITVNSLAAEEVNISAVDGKCDFTGICTVGDLSIETVNGDITFVGDLMKLDCEGVSADFRGTLISTPHSIILSTVSGNVDLLLPENAGFTARLSTVDGKFTSDFDTVVSGKRYTCGDGKCTIEIEGVSGDITINRS